MAATTGLKVTGKSLDMLLATLVTASATLLSRVLGLARDVVIAALFGMGSGVDAFFVAQRLPNFLRRLFAEGAFSQAFVPVLSQYNAHRDSAEVRDLIDHVAGMLALATGAVTLIAVVAAPAMVWLFAPGFAEQADKFALTAQMLRITFPYLVFISLAALSGAVLNASGRFAGPALTPVFLNLSLIGAAYGLAPHMDRPVVALAWGVFVGGLVQLLWQVPFLARIHRLPRPRWRRGHAGVKQVLSLMWPVMLGASVAQVNLLLDTLLASFLPDGSVSWLYFSDRLLEFPLGVFGVALGTVLLPGLSRTHADGNGRYFSATIDWALRWVLLVGLPATVALAVLAGPLLAGLFAYGQTSAVDIAMASRSLIAYAPALLGVMVVKVLAPSFYARQDTRTPVRIAIIALIVNAVFNLLLIWPLAHAGLALATSISGAVNGLLLWRALKRQGVYQALAGWWRFAGRVGTATLIMAVTVIWLAGPWSAWLGWGVFERASRLGLCVVSGLLVYLGALFVTGLRPASLRRPEEGAP